MDKYDGKQFSKSWGGLSVNKAMWDLGQSGNWHKFTSKDGAKMPKGEYVLKITEKWSPNTTGDYADLK